MIESRNCLEGFECPKCGSREPFYITVTCSMEVYDDGTENYSYVEWSDESGCVCRECEHSATVAHFTNGLKEEQL